LEPVFESLGKPFPGLTLTSLQGVFRSAGTRLRSQEILPIALWDKKERHGLFKEEH
jgi:hypothetical protein